MHFLHGKILNICVDFERNCEDNIESGLRSDSNNADAWLELGIISINSLNDLLLLFILLLNINVMFRNVCMEKT